MLLYPIVWVQTALTIFFSLQLSYNFDGTSLSFFSPSLLGISGTLDALVNEWIPHLMPSSKYDVLTTSSHDFFDLMLLPDSTEFHIGSDLLSVSETSLIVHGTPVSSSKTQNEEDKSKHRRYLRMNIAANISACLSTLAFCIYSWHQKNTQKVSCLSTIAPILEIWNDESICATTYFLLPREILIIDGDLSRRPVRRPLTQSTSLDSAALESVHPIIFEVIGTPTVVQNDDYNSITSYTQDHTPPTQDTSSRATEEVLHIVSPSTTSGIIDLSKSSLIEPESAQIEVDTVESIDPTSIPLPEDSPEDWSSSQSEKIDDFTNILNHLSETVEPTLFEVVGETPSEESVSAILTTEPGSDTIDQTANECELGTLAERLPLFEEATHTVETSSISSSHSGIDKVRDEAKDVSEPEQDRHASLDEASPEVVMSSRPKTPIWTPTRCNSVSPGKIEALREFVHGLARKPSNEAIKKSSSRKEDTAGKPTKPGLPVRATIKRNISSPSTEGLRIPVPKPSKASVGITTKTPARVVSEGRKSNVLQPKPINRDGTRSNTRTSSSPPAKAHSENGNKTSSTKDRTYPIFKNPSLLESFLSSSSQSGSASEGVSRAESPQLQWDSKWGDGREILYQSYGSELMNTDLVTDDSSIAAIPAFPRQVSGVLSSSKRENLLINNKSPNATRLRQKLHEVAREKKSPVLKTTSRESSFTLAKKMTSPVVRQPSKNIGQEFKRVTDHTSVPKSPTIPKTKIQELEELPLPSLLQRIQSSSTSVQTPIQPKLTNTGKKLGRGLLSTSFSPNLMSSVPRETVKDTLQGTGPSASVNFADLAKNELVLHAASSIPAIVVESTSPIASPDVSSSKDEGEVAPLPGIHSTMGLSDCQEDIEANVTSAEFTIPSLVLPASPDPLLSSTDDAPAATGYIRASSLSRVLAEPFTLMDGLPSPDISHSVTDTNRSTTSNQESRDSSTANSELQMEHASQDTSSGKLAIMLSSDSKSDILPSRRRTWWDIVNEEKMVDADAKRDAMVANFGSYCRSSVSSSKAKQVWSDLQVQDQRPESTPSLISDVATLHSSIQSISPQTETFCHSVASQNLGTSFITDKFDLSLPKPLLGSSTRRKELIADDADDSIPPEADVFCLSNKSRTSPHSPQLHNSYDSENMTYHSVGRSQVSSRDQGKSLSGSEFEAQVRRPTTPPSPRPRSSWFMPGSKEDSEFWAAYEERQKKKAASRHVAGKTY